MQICNMAKRNIMLFFKDRSAVFFSFMAVFVVLGLYIAFLGDMMIKPLEAALGDGARELSDTWIMAGTIGTVSLTSSLSVLEIIIQDKNRRILDDFTITPMSRRSMMIAYIISTFLITYLISIITLLLSQIYIIYYGGQMIRASALCQVLVIMGISIFCCISVLYVLMSFFHSTTAFTNVTTIIGTLSGFLMGIYVPIGSLPPFLQSVIRLFPPSHGASLLRKVMMEDVLSRTFAGLPQEALLDFRKQFGLDFYYQGNLCESSVSIMVLLGTGLLFLIAAIWRMKRKK